MGTSIDANEKGGSCVCFASKDKSSHSSCVTWPYATRKMSVLPPPHWNKERAPGGGGALTSRQVHSEVTVTLPLTTPGAEAPGLLASHLGPAGPPQATWQLGPQSLLSMGSMAV